MRLKADLALQAKVGSEKTSLSRSIQEKDQIIGELRTRISELTIEVAQLEQQQKSDCARCPGKDHQIG